MKALVDPNSQTFSMPPCLRVPIAASDLEAIDAYVGKVKNVVNGRDGQVKALLVDPYVVGMPDSPKAPLYSGRKRRSSAYGQASWLWYSGFLKDDWRIK